jgi:DNA-binding beta-propeller fold protein YncE
VQGAFAYEADDGWAKLPEGWTFPEVADVAVDSNDNLYVFNRGNHPVIVFDKAGNAIRSFGEGFFGGRAHGIAAGVDGFIYCVENTKHAIHKFTQEGELVFTLGEEGKPAPKWSNKPFNLPTNMEVSPKSGDIYVSDGYGNAAIHRFSQDGALVRSWGDVGCDPGQFQHPHDLAIDENEYVYVCDRENYRVQIFDGNTGKLEAIWHDIYRPTGIHIAKDGTVYICELLHDPRLADCETLGHRISIYDASGTRVARLGAPEEGDGPGQFTAPHGCDVDSQGNIYVGEVSFTEKGRLQDPPKTYQSLRRLRKLP